MVLYFSVFNKEGQGKFHCIIHRLVNGPPPLQEKFLALDYVVDFQQAVFDRQGSALPLQQEMQLQVITRSQDSGKVFRGQEDQLSSIPELFSVREDISTFLLKALDSDPECKKSCRNHEVEFRQRCFP